MTERRKNGNTTIDARLGAGSYTEGYQCSEVITATNPACASDHWCFGLVAAEHVCVRRFAGGGLWFNYGIFPAGYYAGTVWVR